LLEKSGDKWRVAPGKEPKVLREENVIITMNRSNQSLAVVMTRFDFMKQFSEFATLAPASGGSALSR